MAKLAGLAWPKWLGRLIVSDSDLEAEDLQSASAEAGATPMARCRHGQKVAVSGRLISLSYAPSSGSPVLEADLFDGTDKVKLIWLGRRHIAGIYPGRGVTVKGRIAQREGQKVIYNPNYTLEPSTL